MFTKLLQRQNSSVLNNENKFSENLLQIYILWIAKTYYNNFIALIFIKCE